MRYYFVTGDILKAFGIQIESETPLTDDDLDKDEFHNKIAEALELRRFNREEGLNIQSIEEVDEHGCEIDTPEEES